MSGRCFLFAICPAPHHGANIDTLKDLVSIAVKKMDEDDIDNLSSVIWGDTPVACGLASEDQTDIDYIIEAAHEALDYMLDEWGPDDAGIWTQHWNTPEQKDYWLTGGVTSGDVPTDAYNHIRLLAEIGAWE